MAEVYIDMPDATERAQTNLSLRSHSSFFVSNPDQIGVVPYNIWSIEPYFTIGGTITREQEFPVSLAFKVEGNSGGNRPILRSLPWEPKDYVYRLTPPASRWVAGPEYVAATTGMVVSNWYDAMEAQDIRVMRPTGQAKSLVSIGAQMPAFSYRGRYGWTDCDAVSIQPASRMSTPVSKSDYTGFGLAVIGTLDKAGETPYRLLAFETTDTVLSMMADGHGRLVLMVGDEEIAAMPGRHEVGMPVAVLLHIDTDRAGILLVDGGSGRSAAYGQVDPEVLQSVRAIGVGAPMRTDNEVMEIAFWNSGEPAVRIAAQLMAVLAYYRNRRPE